MAQEYQAQARPLAIPLVKLRDSMKQTVSGLLRKLFENADDALFAMADKAGSNGDQALFFDAMRELRLQKKHIATAVVKGVIQSFNELGHYREELSRNGVHATELEELSVIQNDELEMKVAVEGMVNRTRSSCSQSLEDLRERCEYLMSPMTLKADQTPASPEILSECFAEGVAELEIGIRARLVVLKLFEKYVLSAMVQAYTDANNILMQQGVLPEIKKYRAQRARPVVKSASSEDIWSSKGQTVSDADIPTLSLRGDAPFSAGQSQGGLEDIRELLHAGDAAALTDEPPMLSNVFYSQNDLVSTLTRFQGDLPVVLKGQDSGQPIDFRRLLDKGLAGNGCTASYTEMDSDIINLVSMLFEFILGDRQLQPTMKVLIGRLQIPILKVAIMDRTFFNKGGHPARKLLNEIASAAIGWNEPEAGKADRLRAEIERVVDAVVEDFDEDMGLFEELLHSFKTFMDVERRRSQLVEQRTKDSEQGKAASEQAKLRVQTVLNEALADAHAPESAVELLRDGWSKVMIIHHLKGGEESKQWLDACRLVNELLWTFSPSEQGMSPEVVRESLLERIPKVIEGLDAGLQDVAYDEFRRKELLHQIEAEHVKILQDLQVSIEAQQAKRAEQESIDALARETADLEAEFNCQMQNTIEQNDEAVVEEIPAQSAAQCTPDESVPSEETVEEIVLVAVDPEPDSVAEIDENDPFVRQVDHFTVGCWFEFNTEERKERCKLAAIIKATGKYIFVNRSGIKVAEKTRMGLAVELRRGSLQILNDGLLFDRALESIITNLRGKQNQA